MSLSGNVETLSLSDLLQVTGGARRTCHIHLAGKDLDGDIHLVDGEVVAARCVDIQGPDALVALLAAHGLDYQVLDAPEGPPPRRNVDSPLQRLLLDAARRLDEGSVPNPHVYVLPTPKSKVARVAAAVPGGYFTLAGAAVMACIVGGCVWATRTKPQAAPGMARGATAQPDEATIAVEASQLRGAGDALPKLIEGRAPRSPLPSVALTPTVECRLLVSRAGRVLKSDVHGRRPDLQAFEEAALRAVRDFRFEPARQHGAPTPVWINWPVSFRGHDAADEIVLHVKGSDTIGAGVMPELVKAYAAEHPATRFVVESLGSSTAFAALFDGSADLGASARPVGEAELERARRLGVTLHETVIGHDGIAVVVHPSTGVTSLDLDQLGRLYRGEVKSWRELGGADRPVALLVRPPAAATRTLLDARFHKAAASAVVVEKSEEMVARVAAQPGAIGFVGLGFVTPAVKALALAPAKGQPAIEPTASTVRSGAYALTRPLLVYSRGVPSGEAAQFLHFAMSRAAQERLAARGFVPEDSASAQGGMLAASTEVPAALPKVVRIPYLRAQRRGWFGAEARQLVSSVADAADNRRRRVLIVGNVDGDGDGEAARRTALARATDVAELLAKAHVASHRVSIESAGAELPVASNATPQGRDKNRRVDVYIYTPPASPGRPGLAVN